MAVGIIIDIVLERVAWIRPRRARARLARLLQAYATNGLTSHPPKPEEQVTTTTKWGLHIDGVAGVARTPVSRAVFLANLMADVARLGVANAALLESLVGSWVCHLTVRRLCLCLLDLVYDGLRGRQPFDLLVLSRPLREELLVLVALAPIVVADLRAAPTTSVFMSDASDQALAMVQRTVPPAAGRALLRYGCQKGRWARLLPPAGRWRRAAGVLAVADELPAQGPDTGHSLWDELIPALRFEDVRVVPACGRDHINVEELRVALMAEEQPARRQPLSRPIGGTDSQVALACLKGRSSSPRLNGVLRRGLPAVLQRAIYPG